MDNATKKYLAVLEARILKLESTFEAINQGMSMAAQLTPDCNQCGADDPANNGYVCIVSDCCQGLNPDDDNPS